MKKHSQIYVLSVIAHERFIYYYMQLSKFKEIKNALNVKIAGIRSRVIFLLVFDNFLLLRLRFLYQYSLQTPNIEKHVSTKFGGLHSLTLQI